ncbi:MAG: glycosyltransferase family 39 protein [Variibacter sp.]
MPFIALIVEFLRARPAALAAAAIGAQGLIWVLLPTILYASPPGELAQVLAVGHEWQIGSWLGPPLAPWLAELAFRAAGWFGVYLLAQICVAAALWVSFALGRRLLGATYAAMAVLLMAGVLALTVPTPDFGPAVLAMPLTACALLAYWRGLTERRAAQWLILGGVLGLLGLTSSWALLLMALLAVFTVATPEGRAALRDFDPWAAAALALVIPFPYIGWLYRTGLPFPQPLDLAATTSALLRWPVMVAAVALAHAGFALLVLTASPAGADRQAQVPELERAPFLPLTQRFAVFFALAPIIAGTLVIAALDRPLAETWSGYLMLMSGIGLMAVVPTPLRIFRQHLLGPVWLAVLLAPPAAIAGIILILPWTSAAELVTQEPASAMARFFTDSFHRRVGQKLEIVVGDTRDAYLIAAASHDRPSVASAEHRDRTPWVTDADIARKGGVVVWPLRGTSAEPPPALRARFPDLVAEVPPSFRRPIQGLLPTYRLGWGVIRPSTSIAK